MTDYGLPAQARARPDAIALIDGPREITYRELDDRARRMALRLRDIGVSEGDRVAVLVPNCAAWFEAVHGVGRLGAITVPVNTHFKAAEVNHLVDDSGAVAAIVHTSVSDVLADQADLVQIAIGEDGDETPGPEDSGEDVPLGGPAHDGWPTVMTYTSGTTGRPKGVSIGEDDFRRRADGIAMMGMPWDMGPDDVHILVGPTYHAGPAMWAQLHLALGATVVIMRRWDAEDFLDLVEKHEVTTAHVVPANFTRLLDLPDEVRAAADLSSIRVLHHAAAPCPVPVKRRMMEWLPEGTVWEYYGASEGGGSSISPAEWLAHPGSVGRPYPGNEFKVTDDEGNVLPAGQTGVLWVRTARSSFEYHDDPAKTAETYDDEGYHSVGDMGYIDDEGYLFITDRKSDMVISGGVNIYPREIENCLYEHPSVTDCAVFGVPDDHWGEALLAVVQPTSGTTLSGEEVIDWCREHLADYKRPRHVELVEELPRQPNGKVLKRQLREDWIKRLGEIEGLPSE